VIGGFVMNNKKQLLQESWIEMLGSWSKSLLKYMYGDTKVVATLDGKIPSLDEGEHDSDDKGGRKFVIRGKYKDVKVYAQALVAEKNYLDAYSQHGKDHPQTIKQRQFLNTAIRKFESTTGLIWPFQDEG
jgi:hypothetical protein